MDHPPERLERRGQQTYTIERQRRRWRSVACGIAMLGLLGWGLPLGLAREEASEKARAQKGLEQRVAVLEKLLKHFSREGTEIFITGANLHLVNGLGSTNCFDAKFNPIPNCPNGLGNLIVGYNEPRPPDVETIRTGSHNVVVGPEHNFSRFGGLVVGAFNEISGDFASISGGQDNTASGLAASVSGGQGNTANGEIAAVSGGAGNTASGSRSWASGGAHNTASGAGASVSGGILNTANRDRSSVNGGNSNTASGIDSSVSGGQGNTAGGDFSSVSGGRNRTAEGDFNWVAGSLVEDD
jgi:hypothetical protein